MNIRHFRILARLRFRQFFRQKNKGLVGKIILLAYFWFLEVLLFVMLRKEGVVDFPPLLVAGICLSFIIPDALFKLIFLHDETVMDAFIKTRPIQQGTWDRFLTISQFWKSSNLSMPLIMAPACLLFLPFGKGLLLLLALYLLSVFGGFIVMLLKHRGNYQQENLVSPKKARTFRQGSGNHVFGLQSRSFKRSRRLKTAMFVLWGVFLFNFITQGAFDGPNRTVELYLVFLLLYPPIMLPQYGLGVEANFFSGIWTKPFSLSRLLTEKFLFSALIGVIATLVILPFCLWFHIALYVPLANTLFAVGVGELFVLMDAYNCVPFDIFGKTFFNYQGASSTWKGTIILGTILLMVIPLVLPLILPKWAAYLIIGGLGLAGILLHRPYFRWVERKFLKNRYKYMEKYLSI